MELLLTPFEAQLEKAILRDLPEQCEHYKALYFSVKKPVLLEIASEIKGMLPNMSDHGPHHIKNVFENTLAILGTDIDRLTGIELYCLALAVLFHDVGNLEGRENHNKNISKIYDFARNAQDASPFRQEKSILLKIAGAHCGRAVDGSKDTIKDVPELEQLSGRPVRARILAAILRFADELAEGPQRTSRYLIQTGSFEEKSVFYHQYAAATDTHIDKLGNRIALDYNIELKVNESGRLDNTEAEKLDKLLTLSYSRLLKLDEERKYAKHYCDFLAPFKETSARFRFWVNNEEKDPQLRRVILNDKVVPGDAIKLLTDSFPEYEVQNICKQLGV